MSEETQLIKDHYERLSCGHQNNLLLTYPDLHKNVSGVCPKGCKNIIIKETVTVDVRLAGIEEFIEE